MQSLLEADGEALARKAIELAKGGDLAALRMCMDRLVPARKHEPIAVDLPRLDTAADTVTARRRSWPRLRPASSRRRRPPTSPRWSTSTCGRWRRRSSRSAWPSSKAVPCRPMPTRDENVERRSPTHAAAAAAVAEPDEQARESSRPGAPNFFHLEGPWGYARRH